MISELDVSALALKLTRLKADLLQARPHEAPNPYALMRWRSDMSYVCRVLLDDHLLERALVLAEENTKLAMAAKELKGQLEHLNDKLQRRVTQSAAMKQEYEARYRARTLKEEGKQ